MSQVNNPSFDLRKHPFPSCKPALIQESEQLFLPNPGTNLNDDAAITFEITTPTYTLLECLEQPFVLTFEIKRKVGETYEYLIPSQKADRTEEDLVVMPSSLGGGCFFDSVSLEINGVKILEKNSYIGNNDYLYTSINKIFATSYDRTQQLNGGTILENSHDANLGLVAPETNYKKERCDAMETELANTDMGGKAIAVQQVTCFGFDSVPFLGYPNNCLQKIRDEAGTPKNTPPKIHGHTVLPPGTKLTIKLFKAKPIYKKLLWNFKEDVFVSSTMTSPSNDDKLDKIEKVVVDMKSLYFRMRGFASPQQQLVTNKLSMKSMYYPLDLVNEMDSALLSDTKHTTNIFNIRDNTKLIYIFFMREHCLWPSESKTPLPGWFTFPTGMETLQVKLNDGHNLVSMHGFKNLGGTDGNQSVSARAYYSYLKGRGFIDDPFFTFFPRVGYSLKQALVFDLSNQELGPLPTIRVDITWTNNSPKKYSIVMFTVGSGTLEIKPNHHVNMTYE